MKTSKKILVFFLVLFLGYSIWLGYQLIAYKQIKRGTPEDATPPYEIEGAYHIHSRYSDGRASRDQIAKIASGIPLRFIILTDHGKPNYRALAHQGWKDNVLVLAGSELSVSRGHLVALGFKTPSSPSFRFARNAENAIREVAALGGFSVVAHPYSKTIWSWGELVEYDGIELTDADSAFRSNAWRNVPYLPALLLKPEFALLKMLFYPEANLRKWDRLNPVRPLSGFFSADAHFFYRTIFSVFRLHILLSSPLSPDFEEARNQVFEGLRKRSFFSAVDGAAEARGFRFWAEDLLTQSLLPMGSVAAFTPESRYRLHIQAPYPFAKEARLIRDGELILSSDKNEISTDIREEGTYRVEIYLREKSPLSKDFPWIVSNPLFLRKEIK